MIFEMPAAKNSNSELFIKKDLKKHQYCQKQQKKNSIADTFLYILQILSEHGSVKTRFLAYFMQPLLGRHGEKC